MNRVSSMASRHMFLLLVILLFNFSLYAQWARVFGSTGDEGLNSICQTPSGDYIAAGCYWRDFLLMKIAHDGKIKWTKTGTWLREGSARIVLPKGEDGCIVAINTWWDNDIWIFELDQQGNTLWGIRSSSAKNERCSAITETRDGGYLLAGKVDTEALIIKLSSGGDIIWQKSYARQNESYSSIVSIQETMDGGIIVTGHIYCPVQDIWICKMGNRGGIVWEHVFHGRRFAEVVSVVETFEGNYTVCGKIDDEIWIAQLNPMGGIIWQKSYRGERVDGINSLCHTSDGGYIAVGVSTSGAKIPKSGGSIKSDILLIKLSSLGDILWQKAYGGDFSPDSGHSVYQTLDGSLILVGTTSSWGAGGQDALILKLWRNGNISPACSFMRKVKIKAADASFEPQEVKTKIEKTNIKFSYGYTLLEKAPGKVYALGEKSVHKLKIKAGKCGTTDPPPGVYTFANGTAVTIKAIEMKTMTFTDGRDMCKQ